MSNLIIIDLKSIYIRAEIYLERFVRSHKDLEDRVNFDAIRDGTFRDYLYNRIWNTILEQVRYQEEDLEEDLYLGKIFSGYTSDSWFRDSDSELIIDDPDSHFFLTEWVEEIDDMIDVIIKKNRISVEWELFDLDFTRTTLSIEIYGDWRAKKWSEENNIEY